MLLRFESEHSYPCTFPKAWAIYQYRRACAATGIMAG